MIKGTYNYIFHCNEHSGKWYCFHRDDSNAYWSGSSDRTGKQHPIRIGSGKTPNEAWKNIAAT